MGPECSSSDVAVPDVDVVTRLLRDHAPGLAHLPVRPSPAAGSSNWVFRIGDDLAVRLPRSDDYVPDLEKEVRWLPRLGPQLSVPVPEVVEVGRVSPAFPRPWAVVTWLPGVPPEALPTGGETVLAESLGEFVRRLHEVPVDDDVPRGPEHGGYRCGEPVTDVIDRWCEEAATELADLFDPDGVREAWRRLRDVPAATERACWVHTDLSAENLLVDTQGRLSGVIDFGGVGVGDGSVDLLYAWSMFDAPAREVLRRASGVDEATWVRARAWSFVGPGLLSLAHYRDSMPDRAARLTVMVQRAAAEAGVDLVAASTS